MSNDGLISDERMLEICRSVWQEKVGYEYPETGHDFSLARELAKAQRAHTLKEVAGWMDEDCGSDGPKCWECKICMRRFLRAIRNGILPGENDG